jgi:hypothetical protein
MRNGSLGSPCTVTVVERSDGSTTEYNFRMLGFHAMMAKTTEPYAWYRGADSISPGHLIFDPPGLRMEFHLDRGSWNADEARWVEDVVVLEYDLRC